ncbi:unnamed protein product [Cunninghamella blakesleeana]
MATSKRKRNTANSELNKETITKRTRSQNRAASTAISTRTQNRTSHKKKTINNNKRKAQKYVDESNPDLDSEEDDSVDDSDYKEDSDNNGLEKDSSSENNDDNDDNDNISSDGSSYSIKKNKSKNKKDKKKLDKKGKSTKRVNKKTNHPQSVSDDDNKEMEKSKNSNNKNDSDGDNDVDNDSDDDDDITITTHHFNPSKIDVPVPKSSPFPDAIPPATLIFLAKLKVNNNKEFVQFHTNEWKKIRNDFLDFVELLANELHQIDPSILIEPPKNAIYRLSRDLRFSPDRIPYKEYVMASFTTQGKRSELPGYHIKIQPGGNSGVAVGIFQPSSILKQRMRSGMIRQGNLLRESLETQAMKDIFGEENVGMKLLDNSDKLKVAPKGIAKDHPEIELLKFNSVFIRKKFDDIDVVSEGFLDKVLDTFDALLPFIAVLNSWVV